jgi:hypothetical protein
MELLCLNHVKKLMCGNLLPTRATTDTVRCYATACCFRFDRRVGGVVREVGLVENVGRFDPVMGLPGTSSRSVFAHRYLFPPHIGDPDI